MKHQVAMIVALSLLPCALTLKAQEVEPGVQTSSAAAPVQRSQPTASAPTQAPKAKPSSNPKEAATPSANASSASAPKGTDRIQLDTTQISGNRELPKVMYVVPWRHADPGDFAGRPPNSLLDEALTPIDRDVFRRQNRYYGVLQGQAQSSASQAGAAGVAAGAATPKDEK